MSLLELPTKTVGEVKYIPATGWDFSGFLSNGDTISGFTGIAISVYAGTDPGPALTGTGGLVGNVVWAIFTGGLAGVIYQVTVTVTTTNGQTLKLMGYLVVTPDLV